MPERLKDIFFTEAFITNLGAAIQGAYPPFDQAAFNYLVYADQWADKELKERMRHITRCLQATLPQAYPEALPILEKVAPSFAGFDGMVFPDFVECYGLDHWDLSLPALALFTQYSSAEFAIRPFLASDLKRCLHTMVQWARDENHHVRRLASEGCRPRLPWASALPTLKKDPTPILPILEILKNDPSEYVRKSVANNLNDISKDHPELVLDICDGWYGQTKNTDWIVKHACRTLLKAGNKRALLLFGFGDPAQITINSLAFSRKALSIGDDVQFTFELELDSKAPCQVRLEFGVDYVKAKGKTSRKVFQIKEANFEPGIHTISKKHSFQNRTTRKHYPGPHQISIIVNGIEKATGSIALIEPR